MTSSPRTANTCNLPDDILRIIFSRLDKKDLIHLSYCSHRFHTLVVPLLYTHLEPTSVNSMSSLAKTLVDFPEYFQHVRSLSFSLIQYRWHREFSFQLSLALNSFQLAAQTFLNLKKEDSTSSLKLHSLDLQMFCHLNDAIFTSLIDLFGEELIFLDISECYHLTSNCLDHIYMRATKLEELRIAYLPSVEDDTLFSLSSLSSLRILDISGSENITNEGFFHFLQNVPFLERLECLDCDTLELHQGLIQEYKEQHNLTIVTSLHSDESFPNSSPDGFFMDDFFSENEDEIDAEALNEVDYDEYDEVDYDFDDDLDDPLPPASLEDDATLPVLYLDGSFLPVESEDSLSNVSMNYEDEGEWEDVEE